MPNFRNNVSFYNQEKQCGCERRSDTQMSKRMPDRMSAPDTMQRRTSDYTCDPIGNMPLAMAYVPWQQWQELFETEKGFHCGTIFRELWKPFEFAGGGCR